MKDSVLFRTALTRIRREKGMTQVQLEKASGFPPTLVSHYERGDRLPGLENLKALCRGLNCTSDELLDI